MSNLKALIDGDILVYTIGFACQKNIYTVLDPSMADEEEGIPPLPLGQFESKAKALGFIEENELDGMEVDKLVEVSPASHAFHTVNMTIQRICREVGATSYKVYLTGTDNYREKDATILGYKMNRADKPKPLLYQDIINFLVSKHKAQVVNGMEADDALAIVYTRAVNNVPVNVSKDPAQEVLRYPDPCIICTLDKDLKTVPGRNYSFRVGHEKYVDTSEQDALRFFYTQLLTGDSSDNILGIPKVGPKKAEKILINCNNEEEMYIAVYKEYLLFYGLEEFDYFNWTAYEDPTATYSKRVLKPDDQITDEERLKGTAESMLLENARLLHMLRQAPREDGSHMWNPPKIPASQNPRKLLERKAREAKKEEERKEVQERKAERAAAKDNTDGGIWDLEFSSPDAGPPWDTGDE